MKYPNVKILDPQNIHEKIFRIYEIPKIKNFRTTKYSREEILYSWDTHEKKFGPTKYPREKNFRPTKAQWHEIEYLCQKLKKETCSS